MSEELRIVAFGECQECGGEGKMSTSISAPTYTCPECDGQGVCEQQITLGELAGLLLPHMKQVVVANWSSDPASIFDGGEL